MKVRFALWIGLCLASYRVAAAESPAPLHILFDLENVRRYLATDEILTALPSPDVFGLQQIVAFEDHEYFAYIDGRSKPGLLRRVVFVRPGWLVIDDQVEAAHARKVNLTIKSLSQNRRGLAGHHRGDGRAESSEQNVPVPLSADGFGIGSNSVDSSESTAQAIRLPNDDSAGWIHSLHVVTFAEVRAPAMPRYSVDRQAHAVRLELVETTSAAATARIVRLALPDGPAAGRIEILGGDGKPVVPNRLLPAGILPPDLGAAKRRLQWDLPYQIKGQAIWDTRHASSELKRMVESGQIKPCRAVEFGCGTGNDAIYLATQGFDVTAIDISPTALNIAEQNAEKADVQVHWLLADILHPPQLPPFDFVYDRGCYHEVRQHHARQYVAALKTLTHEGAQILILAGNANQDTYWRFEGPPRVREADIRNDFTPTFRLLDLHEFRFDSAPPEKEGPLAWSILLGRMP